MLTDKAEEEVENILEKIKEIEAREKIPEPEKRRICRKCAYYEFCFS